MITLIITGLIIFIFFGILALEALVLHSCWYRLPRHESPKIAQLPPRKASLQRIDELEYELGIGPGGDRKREEELRREQRAVREEVLAQTDPAQYWRDVASDIWRRNGNY